MGKQKRRKQDKKNALTVGILTALCCLSIAVMVITAAVTLNRKETPSFTPPEFDAAAVEGEPDVPQGHGYSPVEVEQGYIAYVWCELTAKGGEVDVYFTSPRTNTVWLMLRILGNDGSVLGQTGVIRPGEYVKSVKLNTVPERETDVSLKIIAYQPETYISMGTVGLNTKLKTDK